MNEKSRYILILKDNNITNDNIDNIKKAIEKSANRGCKNKNQNQIILNIVDCEKTPQFSNASQFGFVYEITEETYSDEQYVKILDQCGKSFRGITTIIISISENFNDLYDKLYSKAFKEFYFINKGNQNCDILDLSDLSNKVGFPCNFNSVVFAHTLYLLCYEFQQENQIDEIILDDNKMDSKGFDFFNDLLKYFFNYLKKCSLKKNFSSKDILSFKEKLDKSKEYYFYDDYIMIIARQTDLKEEAIMKTIEERNWNGKPISFIINEINKITTFKEADYQYPEQFKLHKLK